MAHVPMLALRTRIREVLEDGEGLVRVVSAGRIDGDYWTGADGYAGRARSLSRPRFDIPYISLVPMTPSQFEMCGTKFYTASIGIDCEYALPPSVQPGIDRDTIRATAEQDADVFRQALGWPGNVTATVAGASTGVVDGYLVFVRSVPVLEDWSQQRLLTRHEYTASIRVEAATS